MMPGIDVFPEVKRFMLYRATLAATAERLEEVLAGIADPERLAEAGEWLVRCETGDELLARVNPARTESGPSKH